MRIDLSPQLAARLLSPVLRTFMVTYRMDIRGFHILEGLKEAGGGVVYAFWHNGLLPLVPFYRRFYIRRFSGQRVDVLVSKSRDGDLAARLLISFGFGTIRGSSSRGGKEAMLEMSRRIRGGRDVGIIPDGPKGPRHVAKVGAVALARATGCPILPIGSSSYPAKVFNSWDRFELPLPFAHLSIFCGEPLYVPKEEDLEKARIRLEDRLTVVSRMAREMLIGKD